MRLKILERAAMNAEQGRVYDEAVAAKSPVGGPYYAYIHLPKLFEGAQALRASLAGGPLSRRETQVVNLVVARHFNARYPWFAQVRSSLNAGIEQSIIDAINARRKPTLATEREETCYKVAMELLTTQRLSDATYAAAEKVMGLQDLIALVAVTGSFTTTCMTANAFEVDPPADNPTPLAP